MLICFWYEHNRSDRDEYVTINFDNVEADNADQFEKQRGLLDINVPYDYKSIMHYGPRDFSDNGKRTIITKDRRYQRIIGRATGMSYLDIKTLNLAYQCAPDRCRDTVCPGDGFVDRNCQCVCDGGSDEEVLKNCGE